MAERILVVDDEPDVAALIRDRLLLDGHEVDVAETGEEGLRRARAQPPALVLLDQRLPGIAGTEVLRRLRREAATRALPVVFVSARDTEVDRVVAFELGADDFVGKPFSPRELSLRVGALLRRARDGSGTRAQRVRVGPLDIDVDGYRVAVEGEPVPLTALEFRLLLDLARQPGRVQSRDQLLERVWEDAGTPEPRTVDNLVKRVREKLGPARGWVETIRGVGYRLRDPA